MHFLYPGFLYALFLTAIPVILHLFTFRRYKTVYFSNINWLRGVKKEDKSKSRLRQILILICRVLIISTLVFAFCQPFIPQSNLNPVKSRQTIGIYIDNSYSMESMSGEINLLDIAKNYSIDIIESHRPDSRYYLITNDFDKKHQHLFNKEQVLDLITEIKLSPNHRKLSQIVLRCTDFFLQDDDIIEEDSIFIAKNSIYLISDFQKNIFDLDNIESRINYKIVPVGNNNSNNLFIDSIWFETPRHNINQQEKLFANIRNISEESYNDIPIKLFINDSLKALGSISINKKSTSIEELSYTNSSSGIIHGMVELNDYPITYDNSYYFSYEVKDYINILIIDGQNSHQFLNSVFEIDEFFKLHSYKNDNILSYDFSKFNLIIFNSLNIVSSGLSEAIISFINDGGNLLIIPSNEPDINNYNDLFDKLNTNRIIGHSEISCTIEYLDYDNEIYYNTFKNDERNIDYPSFDSYYLFSSFSNRPDLPLIKNNKNENILSVSKSDLGKVYVFSVSITENDPIIRHPIFFPTIYNIALFSSRDSKMYYIIGEDSRIELSPIIHGSNIHLVNKSGDIDIIPIIERQQNRGKQIIYMGDNIRKADNYSIFYEGNEIVGLSYNYNRLESVLECYTITELENMSDIYQSNKTVLIKADQSGLERSLDLINHGRQLWRIFIFAALGFIIIEIALLRLWR